MSVPWKPRRPVEYGPLARPFVAIGLLSYRVFGPLLRRFPGPVFLGVCIGAVLVVWLVHAYLLDKIPNLLIRDLIAMLGVIGFISLVPLYAIWWERKVSGHIQSRLGPMRTGGWHGWSQSIADGLKLISKEDLIPDEADKPLFRLAPYLAFVPAVLAFMALPFGTYWVFRNLDVALIFILAMMGIEVVGVIVAGWASNNKWAVYGAMREACQMVSYEIPMGMALLIPVMTVGSLSMIHIGDMQADGMWSWLAFRNPFLFIASGTYYVASLANCKRAPFDLPESESELVAGFHTEYSGFRFSLFFFAEYAAMFVVSGLAVILFFGAWHSPLPASVGLWFDEHVGGVAAEAIKGVLVSGPLWFVAKCVFLIYVQMWIRWTLPRVRIDQVLYACVQVMLPMTMLLLLGNAGWELLVPPASLPGRVTNIVLFLLGVLVTLTILGIVIYGWVHRRRLVGRLAAEILPGA
jgi:NADH-quinone oxidoreductase subunit H